MPLDIKRIGQTPYQTLERPQGHKNIPHVRRFFAARLGRVASLLTLAVVFLTPLWFLNFGTANGGRVVLWLLLSGSMLLVWLFIVFILERLLSVRTTLLVASIPALMLFAFLSSMFGITPFLSIGATSFTGAVTLPVLFIGFLWIFYLTHFNTSPGFLKLLFVSYFLGSTILVLQVLIRFLATGYEPLAWVQTQSWLAVFSVNVFLLLAFTMLQKGIAKTVWTMAIVLHVIVLFIWDVPQTWIVLLIGTSMLLVFQMVYSKKLWQRNFIYPLQIWVVSLLLLLVPIKMFTGTTVPDLSTYTQDEVAHVFSSLGARQILGSGPGSVDAAMSQQGVSLFALEDGLPKPGARVLPTGIEHLRMTFGILGLIAWLGFLGLFVYRGFSFVKEHLASLKEQSMSEGVYLGTVSFVSAALLIIALFMLPFAFPVFWLLVLLIGLSLALTGAETKVKEVMFSAKGALSLAGPAALVALVVGYGWLASHVVQNARAAGKVSAAFEASRAIDQVSLLEDATRLDRRNDRYQALLAQSTLATINQDTPLELQKDALQAINATLARLRDSSHDPFVHWIAARTYADLERVAEGSAPLARRSYLRALELLPKNLALPVEFARFYRETIDHLVSADNTASDLRAEARSYLATALKLEPAYLPARLELAFVVEQQDGIPAAIAELEPWERTSPEIKYHVGRLYFNDDNYDTAITKFQEVIKEVPNHSNGHYSLGVAYFRAGLYTDSLTEFQAVLELNPGSQDVLDKIEQVQEKL